MMPRTQSDSPRQNNERRQQIARPIEQEHTAHLPGDALSDEGRAPDDGHEEKSQVCFEPHDVPDGMEEPGDKAAVAYPTASGEFVP